MLAAAEGDTEETRHPGTKKSLERATAISSICLAVMMLLSAIFLERRSSKSQLARAKQVGSVTFSIIHFFSLPQSTYFGNRFALAVTEIFPSYGQSNAHPWIWDLPRMGPRRSNPDGCISHSAGLLCHDGAKSKQNALQPWSESADMPI